MDTDVQESAPQRQAQRARLPARPFVAWTAILGGFIALYEVDRLISGAIGVDGSSRRLVSVIGPAPWSARDAWQLWASGSFRTEVAELLLAGAVALAFMVGGALLLARRRSRRGWWTSLWLRLVALFGLATVLFLPIGAATVVLVESRVAAPGWFITGLGWALVVAVVGLWAVIVALAITTLRSAQVRSGMGRWSRRLIMAIWYHRVSLVFVLAMALLTLVPQRGVWDQLPDVERQWLSGGGTGLRHAAAAMLATVLAAAGLFVLGRARTNRAWRTLVDGTPRQPGNLWWPWVLSPALAAVIVLVMVVSGFADLLDPAPLAVFAGVPLLVVATSALLRLLRSSLWTVGPKPKNELLALVTWRLGDGLAVAVLWIGFLGLLRSFLAPALVNGSPLAWLLLLIGVVGAFAIFPVARRLLPRIAGSAPEQVSDDEPGARGRLQRRLDPSTRAPTLDGWRSALVVFAVAAAVLAVLMVFPTGVTQAIGVIATALAALGSWAAIVGLLLVTLQDRQPAELFRLFRLEAPPFIALLVLPAFLLASVATSPELHGLRTRGAVEPITQQAPDEAFAAWLARGDECELALHGVDYRVLLLVAAQGGGARAADWTVRSMRELQDVDPQECGGSATFLSSGVSGGSVGLAMSRGDVPADGAGAVSEPRALGGAVAGLFVGDLVGGSTGLRVPSAPVGDGAWQWRDRAGLIESVWEDTVPALDEDWAPGSPADDPGPTGLIVLNSVSTGDGCRVVLSQLDLTVSPSASPERADVCRGRTDQPAVTVDLADVYGGCLPGLSWATAAMVSSRFPVVTPAARISPGVATATGGYDTSCGGGGQDLQLVDGGYAEGTGLATLSDVTPLVMRQIVAHNATAVERSEPVVVPVVVFLQNVSRADLRQPPPRLTAEPLVPLQGSSAAALQSADGAWLQRLSDQLADPCPNAGIENDCSPAVAEVRRRIPDGVAVVAPLTEPAVEAPLGWVLSGDSTQRLERAMLAQATSCEGPEPGGYGRLYDVLALLRGDDDPCTDP